MAAAADHDEVELPAHSASILSWVA
jgi:hypothetical protein